MEQTVGGCLCVYAGTLLVGALHNVPTRHVLDVDVTVRALTHGCLVKHPHTQATTIAHLFQYLGPAVLPHEGAAEAEAYDGYRRIGWLWACVIKASEATDGNCLASQLPRGVMISTLTGGSLNVTLVLADTAIHMRIKSSYRI